MWNGLKFKQLLNERKIIKKDFAKKTLGKDRGNLSYYYSANDISFGQACKFADELNVSLDYLGDRSDSQQNTSLNICESYQDGTINIMKQEDLIALARRQRAMIDDLRRQLVVEKDERIKVLESMNDILSKKEK